MFLLIEFCVHCQAWIITGSCLHFPPGHPESLGPCFPAIQSGRFWRWRSEATSDRSSCKLQVESLHLEVDLQLQDPRILFRLNERQFKQLFQQFKDITAVWSVKSRYGLSHVVSSIALTSTHHGLTSCVPWSKLPMLGDGHLTFNRNRYDGYINPYYWVDDHPLLYGEIMGV